jgi:CxxC motif-containing protein (DUF1111 family)
MGLRMKARFMHDLQSLTLEEATLRHAGEAKHVKERFRALTNSDEQMLIVFLRSF